MSKTAIITGASGNLGGACVKAFLSDYNIIATVPPGETLGYDVPDHVIVKEVDLQKEKEVLDFTDTLKDRDISCALLLVGGFGMGSIADTDGESLEKMFSLNFFTAYHSAKPIFQKMQKQAQGGRIILIGCKPALNPKEAKNVVAYALSKSLIFDLADILNAESNSNKVVTHVIAPSVIDTKPNRDSMPDANFDDWVKPETVAENILWLCADQARDVRGSVLKLYGNV